jgi:hypothetical protein
MRRPSVRTHLGALLLGAVAAICGAGEPTPTPTPTPGSETTLSDVAGGIELDKKAAGGQESIVISDENLSTLAGQGRLTEVTKSGPPQASRALSDVTGAGAAIEGEDPGFAQAQEKKQYWQAIYGQQLALVEDIRKQIDVLDYEIPGLWRDFYSWDDPAYRDGVIKPKLDDALVQRQKLEVDMQRAGSKLDQIIADSRKDGGEPGWFRGFAKPPTPKPTEGVMPR